MSARPSSRKDTPGGASGQAHMRELCVDYRGRYPYCVHHGDGKDDPPPPPPWLPAQRPSHVIPAPPGSSWLAPSPQEHLYAHSPHPDALPLLHPHVRLPPAPDIRHSMPGRPSYKECRVGGVPCTRLETRADDSGSPANSVHAASVLPAASGTKGATPAPAPASCEGRACIAYRKLKMRSVALNSENGNANLDGPDERQRWCERAGLERIYVDCKRQGPGAVFGAQVDGTPIGPGGATGSFEPTNPAQTQNPTPNGTAPTATPDPAHPNTPLQHPPAK